MWQFSDGYVIAEIAGANVFCKVVFYVKATSVYYSERSMHCVAHIVFMLAANGRYPVKQNVNIWSIKSLGTVIVHRIAGKSSKWPIVVHCCVQRGRNLFSSEPLLMIKMISYSVQHWLVG